MNTTSVSLRTRLYERLAQIAEQEDMEADQLLDHSVREYCELYELQESEDEEE
jgi:predicted transcriptional regulator